MEKLTFTMENYLEAIYELTIDESGARVSDIAQRLGVTKASTNSAISTLSDKGLIIYERYKKVNFTPAGLELAELIAKKHRVIDDFFRRVLKVDPHIADKDACSIEHVISTDSVYAMQKFLSKL